MIERLENTIQIAVLLFCLLTALYQAYKGKSNTWFLLALFFGCWLMGDLYWLLCLVFYDSTPRISLVSDLNWYASYLFLYLMLRRVAPPEMSPKKRLLPWLGFVFSLLMAVFYFSRYIDWGMRLGEVYLLWDKALSNLVYGMLMGLLLFSAIHRLMDSRRFRDQRFLCMGILFFCLMEYGLWTASCFWSGDSLANPYYWFDLMLTVSFLCLLPATKKAVTA